MAGGVTWEAEIDAAEDVAGGAVDFRNAVGVERRDPGAGTIGTMDEGGGLGEGGCNGAWMGSGGTGDAWVEIVVGRRPGRRIDATEAMADKVAIQLGF